MESSPEISTKPIEPNITAQKPIIDNKKIPANQITNRLESIYTNFKTRIEQNNIYKKIWNGDYKKIIRPLEEPKKITPKNLESEKKPVNTEISTTEKELIKRNLLPDYFPLGQPLFEEKIKLVNELKKFPELNLQPTFTPELTETKKSLLEMLGTTKIDQNKLVLFLDSDDFINREVALNLLNKQSDLSKENIERLQTILKNKKPDREELYQQIELKLILETQGKKAFDTFKNLSENKNIELRKMAAEGLGRLNDKKAIPILEKMLKSKQPKEFQYQYDHSQFITLAAESKAKILIETQGEKALSPLTKMFYEANSWEIKLAAAKGLGQLHSKKTLDVLKKIEIEGLGETTINQAVIQSVINVTRSITKSEGEKAIPDLIKMLKHDYSHIKKEAAKSITKTIIELKGEKAEEILGETFKNYDWGIKNEVYFEKNKHQWLLATQRPTFATPYTEELAKNFLGLEKISSELKKEFNNKYAGLIAYGSAPKGYFKKSDIDCRAIGEDVGITKRFYDIARNRGPYDTHPHMALGENDKLSDFESPDLFSGIFFGDPQRLRQIQKKFIESISDKRWDEIRKNNLDTGHLYKLIQRFGLTSQEAEKIEQAIKLLRTPATRSETLKTLVSSTNPVDESARV